MPGEFLYTEGLTRSFSGFIAVDDVDLSIDREEITAVIGPNGAGKTTLFNLLTGMLEPTAGEIVFRGERIDRLAPDEVARRGIARSFQVTNVFAHLTVWENVRLAAQSAYTGFRPGDFVNHYSTLSEASEIASSVLEQIELDAVEDRLASELSHGQQRHLDIGISLASDPDVLLLDEPTAGMSPEETRSATELIRQLSSDATIVITEHDMEVVMDLSDTVAVMDRGRIISTGTPDEVRADERVQRAYLGGEV